MAAKRHQKPEGDEIIRMIEAAGWTVEEGNKYKAKCPCGQHMKTIVRTPSNPNYWKNLKAKFQRYECWPDDLKGEG